MITSSGRAAAPNTATAPQTVITPPLIARGIEMITSRHLGAGPGTGLLAHRRTCGRPTLTDGHPQAWWTGYETASAVGVGCGSGAHCASELSPDLRLGSVPLAR